MKQRLWLLPLLLMTVSLSGCGAVGGKAASLSIIYGAAALFSALLLVGYCCFIRKKTAWFVLLFSSVLVVNIGYTFLALSTHLEMALMANRVAYLGSVFLPLSMLMIILGVTKVKYAKWQPAVLFGISAIVFLIAASPDILDIYYSNVAFTVVNGVAMLVKEYGPLHPLYLVYLLGYFIAMVIVIVWAWVKKTMDSPAYAVVLAIAVFVNIGVWFIEQLSDIDFEMLSISYIISELFLLGVHLVVSENQRLKALVNEKEATLRSKRAAEASALSEEISEDAKEFFCRGIEALTPTEHAIYTAYLQGKPTKEIMAQMDITENTLKFHNKNLYSKLGVSSRKQLLRIYYAIDPEKLDKKN